MRSEKPNTKLENVISRFSLHRIKNEEYSEKKIPQKLNFTLRYGIPEVKLQKASFEKKVFKVFLS